MKDEIYKNKVLIVSTIATDFVIMTIVYTRIKHSYKKRKDSLETRAVMLILSLELKISGVDVHSKQQKKATLARNCSVKWLWGCFSQFVLLWTWCQGFWGSSEDRYRSKRVSEMLLLCYNLLNSQNIPINQ